VFSFLRLSFSKQKKTRELGRLENLRILGLEEIRNLAYPHFSFTGGRVRTPAGATTSGKMMRLLKVLQACGWFSSGRGSYHAATPTPPSFSPLFVKWPDHPMIREWSGVDRRSWKPASSWARSSVSRPSRTGPCTCTVAVGS
jgi:hypothetical protein